MKVLIINSRSHPHVGGVENSLLEMAHALCVRGDAAKILALQQTTEEQNAEISEIEIVKAPFAQARWPHVRLANTALAAAASTKSLVERFHPDAIWSRSVAMSSGVLNARLGVPLYTIFPTTARMDTMGLYMNGRGLTWRRRAMLGALALPHYLAMRKLERSVTENSKIVVFSRMMRRQLLDSYPRIEDDDIRVIAPGVNTKMFRPMASDPKLGQLADKLGLQENDKVVICVGRLSQAKNIYFMVDAFAECRVGTKLVLVGGGHEEPRLRHYIHAKGLTERVILGGVASDDLPYYYNLATVTCLPTTVESFGQVLLESLACGVPAVAFGDDRHTFLTAANEVIVDGKSGLLVDKATPKGLANTLDDLMSLSETERAEMADFAVADVRRRFSWPRFIAEMSQFGGR